MQEGAFYYLQKPIDLDVLDRIVDRALEQRHRISENELLASRSGSGCHWRHYGSLAGHRRALNVVAASRASRATVLLRGESGTARS